MSVSGAGVRPLPVSVHSLISGREFTGTDNCLRSRSEGLDVALALMPAHAPLRTSDPGLSLTFHRGPGVNHEGSCDRPLGTSERFRTGVCAAFSWVGRLPRIPRSPPSAARWLGSPISSGYRLCRARRPRLMDRFATSCLPLGGPLSCYPIADADNNRWIAL